MKCYIMIITIEGSHYYSISSINLIYVGSVNAKNRINQNIIN